MHKNGYSSDTLMVGHFALLQIALTLSSRVRSLVRSRAFSCSPLAIFAILLGSLYPPSLDRCTFIIYDGENKLTGMNKSNRKSYLACKVKYPNIDETRHTHTNTHSRYNRVHTAQIECERESKENERERERSSAETN